MREKQWKNQWIKNKQEYIPGNQSSSFDLILCFQLKIIIYKSWLTVSVVFMPLINKAAVIFISQSLQTHMWYAAWQHKLVKSACSYQIPPHTATNHKSKVLHPLFPGATAGQSEAHHSPPTPTLSSFSKSHYPPPPLPTMPAATVGPGEENSVKHGTFIQRMQERLGSHILRTKSELPYLLPIPFPHPLSTAFFPLLIVFMILISFLLSCCRRMVW